jgi:hypothetical protein
LTNIGIVCYCICMKTLLPSPDVVAANLESLYNADIEWATKSNSPAAKQIICDHEYRSRDGEDPASIFFMDGSVKLRPKANVLAAHYWGQGSREFNRSANSILANIIEVDRSTYATKVAFGHKTIDDCALAESYFTNIAQCLVSQRPEKLFQKNVYLYRANQQPLIIVKSSYVNSGLTLRDINAEGLLIPRGTLVKVSRDALSSSKEASGDFADTKFSCIDVKPKELLVTPARLTLFMFDSITRASSNFDYKRKVWPNDLRSYIEQTYNTDMTTFDLAAQKIMEICGVKT